MDILQLMPVSDKICGICGESHNYLECDLTQEKTHILDKPIPTKARLTLPEFFNLVTMADGSVCVAAVKAIEKGTRFGPLIAPKLLTLNPNITFPLKLFNCGLEDLSEYHLDTADEDNCNWMIFISPAQSIEEQNLISFQEKEDIFYISVKHIKEGEFLKVWYSPYYSKQMKMNTLTQQPIHEHNNNDLPVLEPINLNDLVKKQHKLMERDNWTCKFCGKLESDVSHFSNHMLEHYKKKSVKKCCDFCDQTFNSRRKLSRHITSKHKKVLNSSNTSSETVLPNKSGNKDVLLGGPLLNVLMNDGLDNTNLIMPNIELNQMNIPMGSSLESQELLLETDSLSLSVDNLLTENVKELDHFNFELGESQEQYVCDICLKSFSKLYYLTQHLKKHTGRYTCQFCLKVFCRRENLDSHTCSNPKQARFNCSFCERTFMLKKYLVRHENVIHYKKHFCENCNKHYNSHKNYLEHSCSAIPDNFKTTFACDTCNKKFFREVYLKKHLKIHARRYEQMGLKANFMCEICANCFYTKQGLLLHKQTHTVPTLTCDVCNKKFHRQEVLKAHKLTHDNSQVECTVCYAKLKNKRNLLLHMKQHSDVKPYKCEICSKEFHVRSNLNTHIKIHSKTCYKCNKTFVNTELYLQHKVHHTLKVYYECPLCNKIVKLKRSLKIHVKNHHPEQDVTDIMSKVTMQTANEVLIKANEDLNKPNEDLNKPNENRLENDDSINNNNNNNNQIGMEISNLISENEQNNTDSLFSDNTSQIDIGIPNVLNNVSSGNDQDNFDTIVDHFENMINSFNSNSQTGFLSEDTNKTKDNKPTCERILDFNDFEIDLENNFGVQETSNINNEECLSMPELLDSDRISLNEDAYILEEGVIVQPQPQGNIVYYLCS